MNNCNLEQTAFMSFDQSRRSVPFDPIACPKPRRFSLLANNALTPFRLLSCQSEPEAAYVCDSKAGDDLLDIIRCKEVTLSDVASTPPFFFGSPPSRATNPLAQDVRFGDEKLKPISPSLSRFLPSPSQSQSPSRINGGGCGRAKFGLEPAAVRVEGFNCLNQNSSIPAMA
ncbi:unnamed protein product [Cochlearia groenlandica]